MQPGVSGSRQPTGPPIHETGFDPYPWVPVSWLPVFGCKANTVLHHKMRSISYVFFQALWPETVPRSGMVARALEKWDVLTDL